MENEEKIDISESEIAEILERIKSEEDTLKSIDSNKEGIDLSKSKLFIKNTKSILDILKKFKEEFLEKYSSLKNENKNVVRGNLYRYMSILIYDYYKNFSSIHHTGAKPYCNSSGETVGLNKDNHRDLHKYIDIIFNDIKNTNTGGYSEYISSLEKLVNDLDQYINTVIEEDKLNDEQELEENKASNEKNISLAEISKKNENYSENSNNNIQHTGDSEDKKCDLSLNNKNELNGKDLKESSNKDELTDQISEKIIELNQKIKELKSSTSDFSKYVIEFVSKKNPNKREISTEKENIINIFKKTEELKTSINSNDFDSDIYYNYIDKEKFESNIKNIMSNNVKIDNVKDRVENLKTNIKNLAKEEEILEEKGLLRQIKILERELNVNDRQLLENRYKKIENLINNFIKRDIKTIENMKITSTSIDNNNRHIFLKKYLKKRRDEIINSYNNTNIKLLEEISKIDKNLNYLDLNQIPEGYVSKENKTFLDKDIFEECKEYEKGLYVEFKNVLLEEMDKIDLLLNNNIEDIIIKRLKRKREEVIKSYDGHNKNLLNDISDIDMIINCLEVGFYKDENYRPKIITILKDLEIKDPEIELLEQLKEEIEFYYTKEDKTEKIAKIDKSLNYLETGFYKDENDRLSIEKFLKELKEQEMKKYADELRSIYGLIKNKNEKYCEESGKRIQFLVDFFNELECASNALTKLQGIFPDQQQLP